MEIDAEFFEYFARRCRERHDRLVELLGDRQDGALSDTEAAGQIARELHDLAGEAALMGFGRLAFVAKAMSRPLLAGEAIGNDRWEQFNGWLLRLMSVGESQAQGGGTDDLATLDDLEHQIGDLVASEVQPSPRR